MKKILAVMFLLVLGVAGGLVMAGPTPSYPWLQKDSLEMRGWPINSASNVGAQNYGYIAAPGNTPVPGLTGSFVFKDASPTPTPHTVTVKGGVITAIN